MATESNDPQGSTGGSLFFIFLLITPVVLFFLAVIGVIDVPASFGSSPPQERMEETASYREGLDRGVRVGLEERTLGYQKRSNWARTQGKQLGDREFATGFAVGYSLGWDKADKELPRPLR